MRSFWSAVPTVAGGVVSEVMTCSLSCVVSVVRGVGQLPLARRGTRGGGAGRRLHDEVPLQSRDLLALRPAPRLRGGQGGDQAQQPVANEEQRRADPPEAGVQRGGHQWGEPGDDGRQLVGQEAPVVRVFAANRSRNQAPFTP